MRRSFAAACLVLGALAAGAAEPVAITTMTNGDLVILDPLKGIVRVSSSNAARQVVRDFGNSEAADITQAGDTLLVTLHLRGYRSREPFTRLARYDANGRRLAEWRLPQPGALLGAATVDPAGRFVYCTDPSLQNVYRLDLASRTPSFATLTTIRDAGTLGPLVVDAKRRRLLIADVQYGRIVAVSLDNPRAAPTVLLREGTIAEPVSMAFDPARDLLYIADAARRRIWTGTVTADKIAVRAFPASQRINTLNGLAVARDGSLWVADRKSDRVWLFAADGRTLRTVNP